MKPITNKYGFVHWGYLFYLMDKSTHEFAVDKIGECVTGNVNVYYHQPVVPSDLEHLKIQHEEIFRTNNTILIQTKMFIKANLHVSWMFTFVKIKHERTN